MDGVTARTSSTTTTTRPAADTSGNPPDPGRLARLAKVTGSLTVKAAAGVLMGLGLTSGALSVIGAGAGLWVVSTVASAATLSDKSAGSIAAHIYLSGIVGAAGAVAGVAAAIEAPDVAGRVVLSMVPVALVLPAVITDYHGMDLLGN